MVDPDADHQAEISSYATVRMEVMFCVSLRVNARVSPVLSTAARGLMSCPFSLMKEDDVCWALIPLPRARVFVCVDSSPCQECDLSTDMRQLGGCDVRRYLAPQQNAPGCVSQYHDEPRS